MNILFHGAAGGVTGSKHLITVAGKKILLECGMYQGRRQKSSELNRHFPFDIKEIDAVILSHAHIDHSGLLPILAKNGYMGPIYCTPPTADILEPMLIDSAYIQNSDTRYFLRHKNLREKAIAPLKPLYSKHDVVATLDLLKPIKRGRRFEIFPDVFMTFYNAGHVLGSAQVLLEGDGKSLAFTGDFGQKNKKILKDPEQIPHADAIISECTYGGRLHKPFSETRHRLGKIINRAVQKGGKLIIPSFAFERTQEILYDLHTLFIENEIPDIPVFIDSPLAIKFIKVFEENIDVFDKETYDYFLNKNKNPFAFGNLKHSRTARDSKALNGRRGSFIIIAASGMCEGGRIRHHLINSLSSSRNTVLFVGYQAPETLGRKLVEGYKKVNIFNKTFNVRANIEVLNGYSGHGDQKDLLENIKGINGLEKIFLVHGDPDQADIFKEKLSQENSNWKITIPSPGEAFGV